MRDLTTAQKAAIKSESTSLARGVYIKTSAGNIYCYTEADDIASQLSVTSNSVVRKGQRGCTVSAIQNALGGQSSFTVDIILQEGNVSAISEADIQFGRLDRAIVTAFLYDMANPAMPFIKLMRGQVTDMLSYIAGSSAKLQCQSLFNSDLGISMQKYSITCRADLGDERCTVDIDSMKENFTVTGVTNVQEFTTNLTRANGYFDHGMVIFNTGSNKDVSVEVGEYAHTGGKISLRLLVPFELQVGDTGTAWPGCDKVIGSNCKIRYDNVRNFIGEPYVMAPMNTQNVNTPSVNYPRDPARWPDPTGGTPAWSYSIHDVYFKYLLDTDGSDLTTLGYTSTDGPISTIEYLWVPFDHYTASGLHIPSSIQSKIATQIVGHDPNDTSDPRVNSAVGVIFTMEMGGEAPYHKTWLSDQHLHFVPAYYDLEEP